jgi:hypothetical protein
MPIRKCLICKENFFDPNYDHAYPDNINPYVCSKKCLLKLKGNK